MKKTIDIILKAFILLQVILLIIQLSSCRKDLPPTFVTGYPNQINTIISTQCSVTGCHNAQSREAAGGLDMTSWSTLFQGGNGGSIVIPYRADRSWLCFYTNSFPDLGISLTPLMPVNGTPISHGQELLIQNWINNGAPDINGNVAFCCNNNRDKYYVSNQGCDEITVFDTKTRLAMRYISVGVSPAIESPHCLRVSPDNKYWYVIFSNFGTVVQKFDAATDELVGNITLGSGGGSGSWNDIIISADGHYGLVSDWEANGEVVLVDLEKLTVIQPFTGLSFPHGLAAAPDFSKIYCTELLNTLVWFQLDPSTFRLENSGQVQLWQPAEGSNFTITPHDVVFTPDYKYLMVTGQASNDLRIVQVSNDSLTQVLPLGTYPQEISLSHKYPYAFISCTGTEPDVTTHTEGTVSIVSYSNDAFGLVKNLTNLIYQPHGIGVDDKNNLVTVCSRNLDIDGPLPHHTSDCGGRDGFINLIDMTTLNFVPGYKTEVSVDPYFTAPRNP